MARHGDARSPSPAGSSYSSSKRSRRDGDPRHERSRQDDSRSHRRRSWSRSPDVSAPNLQRTSRIGVNSCSFLQRRHRDRDRDGYRRRERSVDRRYDDRRGDETYTSSRRDRSRNRRRSKDREERRRSRDRDHRTRREDSRDRTRRRRDGSADSKPKSRRDDSRDRSSRKDSGHASHEVRRPVAATMKPRENNAQCVLQPSKPSTPTTQSADDEMAARRAKIEAWKQKQAL